MFERIVTHPAIRTVRALLDQGLDTQPPFNIVAVRSGSQVKVRLHAL